MNYPGFYPNFPFINVVDRNHKAFRVTSPCLLT